MINYGQIYEVWTNTAMPSKTTARMTRTTLKYVATAHGTDDWCLMPALSLDHAMVLLDAAMASQDLVSQSRSNYRGYLRRLHGFMNQKGIHAAPDSETRMWPSMPLDETDIDRRAQLAYQKFVKWAIRAGVWPHSVKPDDILAWALSEKDNFNMHWRQEFRRLRLAWERLGSTRAFSSSEFPSLPPPKNSKYALPVSAWPTHLRIQWEGMCKQASDVLRKGAMRP